MICSYFRDDFLNVVEGITDRTTNRIEGQNDYLDFEVLDLDDIKPPYIHQHDKKFDGLHSYSDQKTELFYNKSQFTVKCNGPIEVNPTKSGGACLPMPTTHPILPPLIYFINEALLKQVCQHCNIHREKLFNASND